MSEKLGLLGYDYVEFYVGSAKMWAYWHAKAMGMNIVGYSGPETGVKGKVSYYLEQNNLRIVVTSAINPAQYQIHNFVERHGDGVKRWSLKVKDVKKAYEAAIKNGAIPAWESLHRTGFSLMRTPKLRICWLGSMNVRPT